VPGLKLKFRFLFRLLTRFIFFSLTEFSFILRHFSSFDDAAVPGRHGRSMEAHG
jgi:hypothetical protein